jgi:hypothetical protein
MAAPRIKGGIGADGPYWDGLAEGRFRLSRCAWCSRWLWPAHYRGGGCGSWDIAWEDVALHGNLYTWTRNHMVSDVLQERRGDLPYVTLLSTCRRRGAYDSLGIMRRSAGPEDRHENVGGISAGCRQFTRLCHDGLDA